MFETKRRELLELMEEYDLYKTLYELVYEYNVYADNYSYDILLEGSWGQDYPKTKSERERVKKNCGRSCFLDPDNLKYPVCDKWCNKRCDGMLAAYKRARQYNRNDIAKKAINVARYHGCDWVKDRD